MLPIRGLMLAVALAAASGGQALGEGHNLPTNTPGRQAAPGVLHRSLTAVVTAGGHLVRGTGVTGASQPEGQGTYEVDFETDVTACAYVATLGQTGSVGLSLPGDITVVGRSGIPSAIFVSTSDTKGRLRNRSFQVDVGC